jgi:hypothetical protein
MAIQNETLFIFITDLFPASNVVDEVVFKDRFAVKDASNG